MKKVLVTCLRNESDTIENAQVISSYLKYNPKSHISLLCFDDYYPSAKLISSVSEVYTIDRNRIEHLLSGELYSDAFALNSLTQSLSSILSTSWDEVINLSNDETSAYLARIITTNEITGTYISNSGSALTSNKWAMYQNFVSDVDIHNTIHPLDIRHHMIRVPFSNDANSSIIKTQDEFSTLAAQNFSKIRSQKPGNTYVVGISLSHTESTTNYLNTESLFAIVETLKASEKFIPLIITNGTSCEKEIIRELNKGSNNIISVNADTAALPSVIANLDILISQSNKTLALAQCLDVVAIEVKSPSVRSSVYQEGSYSIQLEEDHSRFENDCIYCINTFANTCLPIESQNSSNKVYCVVRDEYSTFRTLVRGEIDTRLEVLYNLQRCFNYTIMGYPVNEALLENIQANIPAKVLTLITQEARDNIIDSSKLLLKTIRSLKSIEQASDGLEFFVQNLDQLISLSHSHRLESSAIALFEGHIENIKGLDRDKNLNDIEKFLFKLKNDFHHLSLILEQVNKKTDSRKTTTQP